MFEMTPVLYTDLPQHFLRKLFGRTCTLSLFCFFLNRDCRLIRWCWMLMMMFTSSVFDRKYPFWANLVQHLKIVSLTWKLVPRLIQIYRVSTFSVFVWTHFDSLSWNLVCRLILLCRAQWWCSLFLFLTGNAPFG